MHIFLLIYMLSFSGSQKCGSWTSSIWGLVRKANTPAQPNGS